MHRFPSSVLAFGLLAGCQTRAPAAAQPARAIPGPPVPGRLVANEAELPRGASVDGVVGDIILENEHLVAIVAARPPEPGFKRWLGALVDFAPRGAAQESLQVVLPAVRVGADTLPVEAYSVEVSPTGALARGRVKDHPGLRVETSYTLGSNARHLTLVSTIVNEGKKAVRAKAADLVYLGNAGFFVPGVGKVVEASERDCAWFGRAGEGPAFGYTSTGTGPFAVQFKVTKIADASFHGAARTALKLMRLPAGGKDEWTRHVVVGDGDLSAVSDVIAGLRAPGARTLRGRVVREDGAALDPRTLVQVIDAFGNPLTRVRPSADGSYSVRLGPRAAQLAATAPGTPGSARIKAPEGSAEVATLSLPKPGLLKWRVTGESDLPIPARLVIKGVAPDSDPVLGADYRAAGAQNTIYSPTGEGDEPLRPGTYDVWATRGIEHSVAKVRIRVEAGATANVALRLARVVPTPGALAADLHLHAEGSGDSRVSFRDRVSSLVAEGVELAVATDHNKVSDYGPAVADLGVARWIRVLSGSEISTTGKERWGHFNAFPLQRRPGAPAAGSPPYDTTTPAAVFKAVREHPGEQVIQVNHPRMDPKIGYFDFVGLNRSTGRASHAEWDAGFDAIEVFNGIWLNRPARVKANLDDYRALLAAGHRFAATGNSDSHLLVAQEVGYPRTYILVGEDDPARVEVSAVVAALRGGRTTVSSGPIIELSVDGRGPGETVALAGRSAVPVSVRVLAAPWVRVDRFALFVGKKAARTEAVPESRDVLRYEATFELPLSGPTQVMAVARGGGYDAPVVAVPGALPIGFTSAVHIDRAASAPVTSPPR